MMAVIDVERLRARKAEEDRKHAEAKAYCLEALTEFVDAAKVLKTPRYKELGGKEFGQQYYSVVLVNKDEEWLSRQFGVIVTATAGEYWYGHRRRDTKEVANLIANTCNDDVGVIELVINEALLGRAMYANNIPSSL
jgi:hypothetical protein